MKSGIHTNEPMIETSSESPSIDHLMGFGRAGIKTLKRPSPGMALFLFGFHLLYFLPLIFPASRSEGAGFGIVRYYYLAYAFMIAGSCLESHSLGYRIWRLHPYWSFFAVSSIVLMMARGYLEGEPFLGLVRKFYIFSGLVLTIHIGLRRKNWAWLWLSFLVHGTIGAMYSIHHFFFMGITGRADIYDMLGLNFLWQCNYAAPFLLLSLPLLAGKKEKIIGVSSFLAANLKALFIYNRLAWFLVPAQAMLLFHTFLRSNRLRIKSSVNRLIVSGILAALLFTAGASIGFSWFANRMTPAFATAVEGTMNRFFNAGSLYDTIAKDTRRLEVKSAITSMGGIDWLIGKGFAGRWSASYLYEGMERSMVHISWVSYLFWGGVLLLWVMIIPVIWVFRILLRATGTAILCCASYLLIMYIQATSFNIATPNCHWVLFCIVLGLCALHHAGVRRKRMV